MSSALVTVLMPVYNGEAFIKEAIESVLKQSFEDFDLLIIDDGSVDNTAHIVHSITDRRIQYHKNERNLKIIETLNKGLLLAQGKYIVRMDADDIALPDRIERQVSYMEAHPDVVLCGSSINRFSATYSVVDSRGGGDGVTRAKLLFDTAINHPSAIIRRKVLTDYHLTYPSEYLHTEDYALWYELSKYGKVANLDLVLLRYRMHGNNLSMQHNLLQYQNMNRMRLHIMDDFFCKSDVDNREELMAVYKRLLSLNAVNWSDMQEMDHFLMKVIHLNQSSKIYDDLGLRKAASWFWFVVFTHENCQQYSWKMLGAFLWNKNSIAQFLDQQYRRRLLIKSVLRWRKK
ncbi:MULTISPECIES: glycosyltransferase family 2 protein [Chitinophagaceae]